MDPSLPESSPQPPLGEPGNLKRTEWDLGATEAVPAPGCPGAQACSLRSRETFNKQAACWWKLPSPTQPDGRKLPNHSLPVGTGKAPFPKKSCFLLLKPGSVFQSYVL